MIDRPILLTGCARSGTSLVAGLIQLSGAFGGQTLQGTSHNAKGFFENQEIREKMVKAYFAKIGCATSLPEAEDLIHADNWRGRFVDAMVRHGYTGGPVYFKAPNSCLIWQVWHEAFPNAQWVVVRRRDEEIIRSCMQTGFMRMHNDAIGWQGWIDTHKDRFAQMKDAGLNVVEYWPEDMFKDCDFNTIEKLITSLGLSWNEQLVREFVEPKLWKGKGEQA